MTSIILTDAGWDALNCWCKLFLVTDYLSIILLNSICFGDVITATADKVFYHFQRQVLLVLRARQCLVGKIPEVRKKIILMTLTAPTYLLTGVILPSCTSLISILGVGVLGGRGVSG